MDISHIHPTYQPLYQQARNLQYQFHDSLNQPDHPQAQLLKREMQQLNSDLELNKKPRDIENRIKTIQHGIMEAQNQNLNLMNYQHSDTMSHNFEQMRRDARKFTNYS